MSDLRYGFGKTFAGDFESIVERVTAALEGQGFGVLTRIDVADTLQRKLDRQLRPYRIRGACNPPLAARAIDAEPAIGLLLPCNVVVREIGDGTIRVEAMDPEAVLEIVANPRVTELAHEVRERLQRMLDALD